jgi:3-oxoadipate enol-lactonase
MATLKINGADLWYEIGGPPDGGQGTILFIHGLMLASESWDAPFDLFARTHRVVRFDLRGQGRSAKMADRLDLDSLAEDAAALIATLELGCCHVVGFSMGSFIALRLAARWPKLVRSLLLVGASAEAEARHNGPRYALMIAIVGLFGPKPLAGQMMKILFGDTFLWARDRQAERMRWRGVIEALPRSIRLAAAASARRGAIRDLLPAISVPTLLLTGSEDRPTPPALGEAVASLVASARLEVVPATGHAVMLEQPELFVRRMHLFLRDVEKSKKGS